MPTPNRSRKVGSKQSNNLPRYVYTGSLEDAARSVANVSSTGQCLHRSAAAIAGYIPVLVTVRRVPALDVGQPMVETKLVPRDRPAAVFSVVQMRLRVGRR